MLFGTTASYSKPLTGLKSVFFVIEGYTTDRYLQKQNMNVVTSVPLHYISNNSQTKASKLRNHAKSTFFLIYINIYVNEILNDFMLLATTSESMPYSITGNTVRFSLL